MVDLGVENWLTGKMKVKKNLSRRNFYYTFLINVLIGAISALIWAIDVRGKITIYSS